MIPLSELGISREEKLLLSDRLFPEANAIFLKRLAESYGLKVENIEHLDYSNHPVWKMEKMLRDRKRKAALLKDRIENGLDVSEFDVKYKTFEEAKASGENHIRLEEPEPPEELNKRIEKLKLSTIEEEDIFKMDDEKIDI